MEFFAEDMGRVAKMRVDEKGVAFKGITPKKVGAVEIAVVGNAKVVAVKAVSRDELLAILQDSELSMAIKDAWVLVADCEFNEEFAAWVRPYVAIVNKEQVADYEAYARGWNVDCGTECVLKKCVSLGVDGNAIEVLFGESRENPIGLLSVKCIKE
jgi:hypothetical protein